jgi:hypothetical protein
VTGKTGNTDGSAGDKARSDERQALVLLKRVLMAKLAEHGVELESTATRGIDQELVREVLPADPGRWHRVPET